MKTILKIDDMPVMNVHTLTIPDPSEDSILGFLDDGSIEVSGVFSQSKQTMMGLIYRGQAMKFKIEWTHAENCWLKVDAIIRSYQTGRRDEFDLGELVFKPVGQFETPPIDPALHAVAMEAMRDLGFDIDE